MAKIFLIEDDVSMNDMYERVFRLSGNEIEIAFDGEEALEKLKKMKPAPDIILLDIMMPKMNGLEFLKKIKQSSDFVEFKDIPVVALTNLSSLKTPEETLKEVISLGAVTYLVKSDYEPSEIVKKVEEIIKQK